MTYAENVDIRDLAWGIVSEGGAWLLRSLPWVARPGSSLRRRPPTSWASSDPRPGAQKLGTDALCHMSVCVCVCLCVFVCVCVFLFLLYSSLYPMSHVRYNLYYLLHSIPHL